MPPISDREASERQRDLNEVLSNCASAHDKLAVAHAHMMDALKLYEKALHASIKSHTNRYAYVSTKLRLKARLSTIDALRGRLFLIMREEANLRTRISPELQQLVADPELFK